MLDGRVLREAGLGLLVATLRVALGVALLAAVGLGRGLLVAALRGLRVVAKPT